MGEEVEILGEFADLLNEHRTATLVGYNVKNFDIPLIRLRAAKYGVKLCLPDRRSQRICDLFDVLGGEMADGCIRLFAQRASLVPIWRRKANQRL